jgi:hypothetical protein
MIDLATLTLGEVSLIEDLSGLSIGSIAEADKPKGKAMAAIAMVIKRRTGEPTFTFNAALALPMNEVEKLLGTEDDLEEDDLEVDDLEDSMPEKSGGNSAATVKPSKQRS